MLRNNGILSETSVPYQHQQNGHAECLNHMVMDKVQSMRFCACLTDTMWEFSWDHAIHVYNCTPICRLKWQTPFEALRNNKPDISHLHIFGCGAYIFLPEDVRANKVVPMASDQPVFYKDIARLLSQLWKQWKKACQEELEALHKCKVFELADLPKGCKAIKNRWVFTTKSDGCKKARLVAKGFSQIKGINIDQIPSPVVQYEFVCLLLVAAALEGWHIEGLNVKSAFLYRQLDEEIYMEQPEGFKIHGQKQKVLCLCQAICGLKQAALAWWKKLLTSMCKIGFERSQSDAGIFIHKPKMKILLSP